MALNQIDIETAFKVIGKLIYLNELAVSQANGIKQLVSGLTDQCVNGSSSDYDVLDALIAPLQTRIKTTITSVLSIQSSTVTYVKNYLTKILTVQAGMENATYSDVLDNMRAVMLTAGQYVDAGSKWMTFFTDSLNYNSLPTQGTLKIPESYITAAVV